MANSPWGQRPDRPQGYHGHLPGPEPRCPDCGSGLGGFTAVKLDGAVPKPGDLTVCCYCEVVLRYDGAPLSFVRVEGDELILARANPDVRLALRVVRKIKADRERFLPDNVVAFPNASSVVRRSGGLAVRVNYSDCKSHTASIQRAQLIKPDQLRLRRRQECDRQPAPHRHHRR